MSDDLGGGATDARSPQVALVLVSHSRSLAAGAVELAAQMAPGVVIVAAGGMESGIGTSFDLISSAIETATEGGRSAVVLTDLGSAVLTTESVLELADDDVQARVRLADAPFVEGAVAAAVTAHGGGDLAAVLAAAVHAGTTFAAAAPDAVASPSATGGLSRTVVLRNPLGLHARPAASLARMVSGYDAAVTINGVNAASVLELMKLGAAGGQQLTVVASGAQAEQAVAAVVEAVEGGFGEA